LLSDNQAIVRALAVAVSGAARTWETEMRLQRISYSEHSGSPQEWTLDGLELGSKNLIVGKNASGKSRTLNVIAGLAGHLSGRVPIGSSGTYSCSFLDGSDAYDYKYSIQNQEVVREELRINSEMKLKRGAGGVGVIWAERLAQFLDFQNPPSTLAAATRRDAIQHGFLESLYTWASTLRHYTFGTQLGKEHFAILVTDGAIADEHDQNMVVGLFRRAHKQYGDPFIRSMIEDLNQVGYDIESIALGAPVSVRFGPMPGELVGLVVRERGMPGVTDQVSMSQGMFRVVSLLIHMNLCQLSNIGSTVLIDDIGEGLDFDRSCRLIKVLRKKADSSNVQLVMSTNDRFVMNQVPLDEWSLMQRDKNFVRVRNAGNSREVFESFKFTGLSNFSFLEMDFINSTADSVH
jgi:energy-coupling factor transporter ATP-binding protein EcfA2